MSRLIFVKLALAVACVCGIAGSASAQLSALAGKDTIPAPPQAAVDPDRAALTGPAIAAQFPQLGTNFKIVAPSSKGYNAFGHALGRTDLWVPPEMGPAENPLSIFDGAFGKLGYRRTEGFDTSLRAGYTKVVLIGMFDGNMKAREVLSAAVQTEKGTWTSKLGSCALIEVDSVHAFSGPCYGGVIAVYEKPTNGAAPFAVAR